MPMLNLQSTRYPLVERDEREDSNRVLVPCPSKTPPDYDTLRAEVMRDFRKTLAYLAK